MQNVGYVIQAVDKYSFTMKDFAHQFDNIDKKIEQVDKHSQKWGDRLNKLKATGKTLFTHLTLPIMAAGGYALKQVMDLDTIHQQMLKNTGSAAGAAAAMENLRRVSMSTEWSPEQLADAEGKLFALGRTTEQASKEMELYAKVAKGSTTDVAGVTSMMTTADIQAKKSGGALNTRTLKMFTQAHIAIIPAIKAYAATQGISSEQVDKGMAKNTLSIKLLHGAMKLLAKTPLPDTIAQSFARAHNIARYFANDLLSAFFPAKNLDESFEKMVTKLQKLEERFRVFAKNNPTLIKTAVIVLGIVAALAPLAIAAAVVAAAFSPVGLAIAGVVLAVTGLTLGFVSLYKHTAWFRQWVDDITAELKGLFHLSAPAWIKLFTGTAFLPTTAISHVAGKVGKDTMKSISTSPVAHAASSISSHIGSAMSHLFKTKGATKAPLLAGVPTMHSATGIIAQKHIVEAKSSVNITVHDPKGVVQDVQTTGAVKKSTLHTAPNNYYSRKK